MKYSKNPAAGLARNERKARESQRQRRRGGRAAQEREGSGEVKSGRRKNNRWRLGGLRDGGQMVLHVPNSAGGAFTALGEYLPQGADVVKLGDGGYAVCAVSLGDIDEAPGAPTLHSRCSMLP